MGAFQSARCRRPLHGCDFGGDAEAAATVAALRAFLALAQGHLDGETAIVHPAIEAREPAATANAHEGHEDREAAFAKIDGLLDTSATTRGEVRSGAGQAPCHRYVRFVAADHVHMDGEAQDRLGTMHRLFTDDELRGIEGAIVGKIDPARMMGFPPLIVPALNRPERAGMRAGMGAATPPDAFAAVIEQAVRGSLTAAEAADVCADLGLRCAA